MTYIVKCECGCTEFTQDTQEYAVLKIVNGEYEIISNEKPSHNDAPIICKKCKQEFRGGGFDDLNDYDRPYIKSKPWDFELTRTVLDKLKGKTIVNIQFIDTDNDSLLISCKNKERFLLQTEFETTTDSVDMFFYRIEKRLTKKDKEEKKRKWVKSSKENAKNLYN